MKPLYTLEQFNEAQTYDKLPLECYQCGKTFTTTKHQIKKALDPNNTRFTAQFCNRKCSGLFNINKKTIECSNCNKVFEKHPNQIKKSKSGNHFCSRSCAATFNNKNKTHGTRRSKLESWLENELIKLYPNLDIHFNQKEAIGSELDIYIPSINLAFELNGIFHYEPIYGVDKLEKIQENDQSKTKACFDAKIDLCIIDTSQQKYFKPKSSKKYLDIITQIINER